MEEGISFDTVVVPPLPSVSPLRGLLEVTRLLRAQEELPELLAAVARTIGESLGYGLVVIDLYRPEWDDFSVAAVHGPDESRRDLEGRVRTGPEWQALLREESLRRGAYALPGRELCVPLRTQDGRLLGVVCVAAAAGEIPRRDEELDVLVALADHAALAVEAARESASAARHRRALEELLAVSSQLSAEPAADEILRLVCNGIREALGFGKTCAALVDPASGRVVPEAAVGWGLDDPALRRVISLPAVEPLLERRFRREGCYLLPPDEVAAHLSEGPVETSRTRAPRGWNGHRLLVPLRGRDRVLLGLIWVDDPDDGLLPSPERLQALRIFANSAAAALVSCRHLDELRFLADHDPLTRLLNRRAFVERLDAEVARALRYGRSFGLAVADVDGFKQLNDRHGHAGGDEALQVLAGVLVRALRRPDDAFRIGGDEFALLLAEASEDDAREVVARIRRFLAECGDERLAGLALSFGCAACPADAGESGALFRRADEALYEAKRTGAGLRFAVS